jgi:NADPH-dependent ferric siderophore reductase
MRTFVVEVLGVARPTPAVRRVTLGGAGLGSFRSPGADAFVYLLLPPDGRADLTVGPDFTWERYRAMARPERPVGAYYTVRAHRPERGELDLDVVLHQPDGPASRWAARARRGDPVAVWGPRVLHEPPPATTSFLLAGDDTAVPAMAALLAGYPAGTPVQVVAEVAGPEEERPLPTVADARVTWLHGGRGPGLGAVVASLGPFPPGTYAWGGGERRTMEALRRHLIEDCGLGASSVCMTAYWRSRDERLACNGCDRSACRLRLEAVGR